ncbi:hypothetical protein BJ741DRAFT_584463 [Chytriomyces cf. hyalinus JEL632]|nr:hypothetical protein BJ741DRAFT_584463 [Chytriomyces cf. hyalinus JEL632]
MPGPASTASTSALSTAPSESVSSPATETSAHATGTATSSASLQHADVDLAETGTATATATATSEATATKAVLATIAAPSPTSIPASTITSIPSNYLSWLDVFVKLGQSWAQTTTTTTLSAVTTNALVDGTDFASTRAEFSRTFHATNTASTIIASLGQDAKTGTVSIKTSSESNQKEFKTSTAELLTKTESLKVASSKAISSFTATNLVSQSPAPVPIPFSYSRSTTRQSSLTVNDASDPFENTAPRTTTTTTSAFTSTTATLELPSSTLIVNPFSENPPDSTGADGPSGSASASPTVLYTSIAIGLGAFIALMGALVFALRRQKRTLTAGARTTLQRRAPRGGSTPKKEDFSGFNFSSTTGEGGSEKDLQWEERFHVSRNEGAPPWIATSSRRPPTASRGMVVFEDAVDTGGGGGVGGGGGANRYLPLVSSEMEGLTRPEKAASLEFMQRAGLDRRDDWRNPSGAGRIEVRDRLYQFENSFAGHHHHQAHEKRMGLVLDGKTEYDRMENAFGDHHCSLSYQSGLGGRAEKDYSCKSSVAEDKCHVVSNLPLYTPSEQSDCSHSHL